MSTENLEAFFSEIGGLLGAEGVNRSVETIQRYGENTMPGGDRQASRSGLSQLDEGRSSDCARRRTRIAFHSIRSAPATISVLAHGRRRQPVKSSSISDGG